MSNSIEYSATHARFIDSHAPKLIAMAVFFNLSVSGLASTVTKSPDLSIAVALPVPAFLPMRLAKFR